MGENPRRMKEAIRCTEITTITDDDGGFRIVGESLGRWGTILVYSPSYRREPELAEDERLFDPHEAMPDVIPCEKITFFQNVDGGFSVVGESQARGVITLLWSPSPQKKMSLNKAQPALFT